MASSVAALVPMMSREEGQNMRDVDEVSRETTGAIRDPVAEEVIRQEGQ
jgi:hypothetical protein